MSAWMKNKFLAQQRFEKFISYLTQMSVAVREFISWKQRDGMAE